MLVYGAQAGGLIIAELSAQVSQLSDNIRLLAPELTEYVINRTVTAKSNAV